MPVRHRSSQRIERFDAPPFIFSKSVLKLYYSHDFTLVIKSHHAAPNKGNRNRGNIFGAAKLGLIDGLLARRCIAGVAPKPV